MRQTVPLFLFLRGRACRIAGAVAAVAAALRRLLPLLALRLKAGFLAVTAGATRDGSGVTAGVGRLLCSEGAVATILVFRVRSAMLAPKLGPRTFCVGVASFPVSFSELGETAAVVFESGVPGKTIEAAVTIRALPVATVGGSSMTAAALARLKGKLEPLFSLTIREVSIVSLSATESPGLAAN